MRKKILAFVFAVALALTVGLPLAGGVSAQDAACDGANGGVDTAFAAATAPGRAGDNVPAGQVDFVVGTVVTQNPEAPAVCP